MKIETITNYICEVCGHTEEDRKSVEYHEKLCLEEVKAHLDFGHLKLGQIIQKCSDLLEAYQELPVIIVQEQDGQEINLGLAGMEGSYRGYYRDLAIEPITDRSNRRWENWKFSLKDFHQRMIRAARSSYSGWKGGEFWMSRDTWVWVSEVGAADQLAVVDIRLAPAHKSIQVVVKEFP